MKPPPHSLREVSVPACSRDPRRVVLAGLILAFALPLAAQTNYTQLHSFGNPAEMASSPYGNVIEGADGMFYGTTGNGGVPGNGTVFRMNKDGSGFKVLYAFGSDPSDGKYPHAALVQLPDGTLYGTTAQGGTNHPGSFFNGAGVLFRLNPDGAGYTVLHHFGGTNDGINPQAALIRGSDGALYGTTYQGGTNAAPAGRGTVYTLNPDGTGYTVLHHFGSAGDGRFPSAALLEGSDTLLYGTTSSGGTNNFGGTMFTLMKDGTAYTIMRHFGGLNDGSAPYSALIEASDHLLYGTTASGGPTNSSVTNPQGTVFSITKQGDGYNVLRSFDRFTGDGAQINAGLVEGKDGKLYGAATVTNASSSSGDIFTLNKDGSGFGVIHIFAGATDANSRPTATLLQTSDGTLYGTTYTGGQGTEGTLFKLNTDGSNYTVLWIFSSTAGDGGSPYGGLIAARDGTLYGTVSRGGIGASGAVYKMNQDGSGYALVFSFGTDTNGGIFPFGSLLLGSDNTLYGTTDAGAAPGKGNQGTVFKLNLDGSGHTVLYSFPGGTSDGSTPQSGVIEGSDGALFGTTTYGGSNGFSGGILYRLQKDGGNYAVLHQFGATNQQDGIGPTGGALVEASDHALYGLTESGGSLGSSFTGGTLFKINKDGSGYGVIYNFGGAGNGSDPSALIEGNDGVLYGTTAGGSTVFKVNKDGSGYSVVYTLGAFPDGAIPRTLIEGGGNLLYGTTVAGGKFSKGTVFKLNKDGTDYTVLYNFGNPNTDGNTLAPGLLIGTNGDLFGTTQRGGFNLGTVYALRTTGAIPPVDVSIQSGNGISLLFTGVALHVYQVQATDALSPPAWLPVATNAAAADGSFQFTDTDAPNHPTRFYRIRE